MLNWFTSLWPSTRRAASPQLRRDARVDHGRAYDAGGTTRVNQKAWQNAGTAEIDRDLLPTLETMRNRGRNERQNSGYAAGIVRTYQDDLVGDAGPKLQIESDDDTWNDWAEAAWAAWCEYCEPSGRQHFVDLLWMEVGQLWYDGEFLSQEVSEIDGQTVAYRNLPLAPDRLATPPAFLLDKDVRGGVRFTKNLKPTEYYILKTHPGSYNVFASAWQYDTIPAKDIIHCFPVLGAGQSRGEPWLSPVLPLFAQLRQYGMDTILAARAAAMMGAAIFKTTHPSLQVESGADLEILDIEPGSGMMLPEGWDAQQLKAEFPTTSHEQFVKTNLSEIGRPGNMPYLKTAASAAGHNYSSARIDLQGYWAGLARIQGWIGRVRCNRALRAVLREQGLVDKKRAPAKWKATWIWPKPPHIDPQKEAVAQETRLRSGVTSLAIECKRENLDWEDVLKQQAKEMKLRRELGLPQPTFGATAPAKTANATAADDGSEPTEDGSANE